MAPTYAQLLAQAALMERARRDPEAIALMWAAGARPGLTRNQWAAVFRVTGYVDVAAHLGDQPAARPTEPVRLYRGAPDHHRFGLSWSTDRDHAQTYAVATRPNGRPFRRYADRTVASGPLRADCSRGG